MGAKPRVVVVGLGPAGRDWLSERVLPVLAGAQRRYLRTRWHPAAEMVEDAESFDRLYDEAGTFEEVYVRIVETLVEAARTVATKAPSGYVVYAVPGSPIVAERAVTLLLTDERVEVEVLPALSFLDLAWQRLGIDPLEVGVRLIDGARFAIEAAGERGPLLVGQCWSKEILSQIKLAAESPPDAAVTVLQRLGCGDESVTEISWYDIDREIEPDHLTSLYIPEMAAPVARELMRLDELVRTLRERCPWDRKQTHQSLTKHLIEEAYEVLDAIAALPVGGTGGTEPVGGADEPRTDADGDADEHLCEELGDLLFQVLFHSRLAAEEGRFDLSDVAAATHAKLVTRHPHVFGDVVADSPEQVVTNWEQIKKNEKGRSSIMEGIPASLPSLALAYKVQKKAASVGFDWPDVTGPLAKVGEELGELTEAVVAHGGTSPQARSELGDLLFSLVNVARHVGLDPEVALRESAATFRWRFEAMESQAAAEGDELPALSLEELDRLWEGAKARGIS